MKVTQKRVRTAMTQVNRAAPLTVVLPDVKNLRDATNIPVLFRQTPLQLNLVASGINPEVYSHALSALVNDVGFDLISASAIMADVMNIANDDKRQQYFEKLILTTGRRMLHNYNVNLSVDKLKKLEFCENIPNNANVIAKAVPFARPTGLPFPVHAYRPVGIAMYQLFELSDDVAALVVPYDESIDINMHLERIPIFGQNEIVDNKGSFRMIVSNELPVDSKGRNHNIEYTDNDNEDEDDYSYAFNKINKKIKKSTEYLRDRLFQQDGVNFVSKDIINDIKTPDGIYELPEWTPLMLSRRENRTSGIIHKALRTWRSAKIVAKRKQLWNAGYMFHRYEGKDDFVFNSGAKSHLVNWIREQSICIFDTEVLEPVYLEVLNQLESVIHSKYPITVEEIGDYLLDMFDMIYNAEEIGRDQEVLTYFNDLKALVYKFHMRDAGYYFARWLVVCGIVDSAAVPANPAAIDIYEWLNAQLNTSIYNNASVSDKLKNQISIMHKITVSLSEKKEGKIPLKFNDYMFTNSVNEYLDAKANVLLYQKMKDHKQDANKMIRAMLESIVVTMYLSNLSDYLDPTALTSWARVANYSNSSGTIFYYPAIHNTYMANQLPRDLLFATLKPEDVNVIANFGPGTPLYNFMDTLAKEIEAGTKMNDGTVDFEVTLENMLKLVDGAGSDEAIGLAQLRLSLSNSLHSIIMNSVPDLYHNQREVEKLVDTLQVFFSVNHISRDTILNASDEDFIAEAIMKLDSLNLSAQSNGNVMAKKLGKQRSRTIEFNRETVRSNPITFKILPTIAFTYIKTHKYRFTVTFTGVNTGLVDYGNALPTVTLYEVYSSEMSCPFDITIREGMTGYIDCKVEAMINDTTVVASGEMPAIQLIQMNRCFRSGTDYSPFDGSVRFHLGIKANATFNPVSKALTDLSGVRISNSKSSCVRSVKWENDPKNTLISRYQNSILRNVGNANDIRKILAICLSTNLKHDFASYYKSGTQWINVVSSALRIDSILVKVRNVRPSTVTVPPAIAPDPNAVELIIVFNSPQSVSLVSSFITLFKQVHGGITNGLSEALNISGLQLPHTVLPANNLSSLVLVVPTDSIKPLNSIDTLENEWNYRKLWYDSYYNTGTEPIMSSIEIATSDAKRIRTYKQSDEHSETEMATKKYKTLFRLFKRLFMIKEYNEIIEEMESSYGKNFISKSTLDWRTLMNEDIEHAYEDDALLHFSVDNILHKIAYIPILNYCLNVIKLSKDGLASNSNYNLLPDNYVRNHVQYSTWDYMEKAVKELYGRYTGMLLNLSYIKSLNDHVIDESLENEFPLDNFIAATWEELDKYSALIPSESETLKRCRLLLNMPANSMEVDNLPMQDEVTEQDPRKENPLTSFIEEIKMNQKEIVAMNAKKELIALYYPIATIQNFISENITARKYAEQSTPVRYIGYNSYDSPQLPYLFELTTLGNATFSPKKITNDVALINFITKNGMVLHFPDTRGDTMLQLSQMERQITSKFDTILQGITMNNFRNNGIELAKLFHEMIALCKQYNEYIIR